MDVEEVKASLPDNAFELANGLHANCSLSEACVEARLKGCLFPCVNSISIPILPTQGCKYAVIFCNKHFLIHCAGIYSANRACVFGVLWHIITPTFTRRSMFCFHSLFCRLVSSASSSNTSSIPAAKDLTHDIAGGTIQRTSKCAITAQCRRRGEKAVVRKRQQRQQVTLTGRKIHHAAHTLWPPSFGDVTRVLCRELQKAVLVQ